MNELIKIEEKDGIETVNARELHEFLEVAQRFNDWITRRIKKYQFVEGQDFTVVTQKGVTEANVFYISLDMAKELSMVENNEKGKEARRYFIAREKQARQLENKELPDFTNPVIAARAWADEVEKRLEVEVDRRHLQVKAVRDQPKVEFYDTVVAVDETLSMNDAVKLFSIPGFGRTKLFKYLRERKVLDTNGIPYQRYIDAGWFAVVESTYTTGWNTHINKTTRVYQKGLDGIRRALKKDGVIT